MRCPHCGKDINEISARQVESVLSSYKNRFGTETEESLKMLAKSLHHFGRRDFALFLGRVVDTDAEDIVFGITWFLKNELHLKGKHWEYCAAIITRRHISKKQSEKNKLQTLPPEYVPTITPQPDK